VSIIILLSEYSFQSQQLFEYTHTHTFKITCWFMAIPISSHLCIMDVIIYIIELIFHKSWLISFLLCQKQQEVSVSEWVIHCILPFWITIIGFLCFTIKILQLDFISVPKSIFYALLANFYNQRDKQAWSCRRWFVPTS